MAPPQEPWSDVELLAAGWRTQPLPLGLALDGTAGSGPGPLTIAEEDLALMQALEAAPAGTPIGALPLALEPTERGRRSGVAGGAGASPSRA